VESVQVEATRRRLKLLCESDRLLGVRDWPAGSSGNSASGSAACDGTDQDDSAMRKKAARSTEAADPELDKRLKAEIEAFRPEIDPPGIDPENRPDLLQSARYALKGSPLDVVKLKMEALAQQAEQVKECKRCELYRECTQKVFGIGHPDTRIVFVGEAPGAEEDRVGYPFMGRAGKLLTDMVEKGMRLRRDHVYICNVVKCRPPENRTPTADEMAACQDHLWAQLSVIEPEIIVALGLPATQTLLSTKDSLGSRRGQFFEIHLSGSDLTGGPVAKCVPTYHPAYLLRVPADKKKAWEDLKKVMAEMGIPASA
jgi:DNA polymerase